MIRLFDGMILARWRGARGLLRRSDVSRATYPERVDVLESDGTQLFSQKHR
jgi:hypothetical protein